MLAQGSNDKTGLDDLLGGRLPEKRAKTLRRLVDAAVQSLPSRVSGTRSLSMDDTRPALDVTADRLSLIREVVGVMCQRWDGWPLFNYGDVISELQDDRMVALDRGPLLYIKVLTTRSLLRSSNAQRERIRATFAQARKDAYPWASTGTDDCRYHGEPHPVAAPALRAGRVGRAATCGAPGPGAGRGTASVCGLL